MSSTPEMKFCKGKGEKKGEKKIVVWLPYLKTTMLIKESDFNPEWMEMPLK